MVGLRCPPSANSRHGPRIRSPRRRVAGALPHPRSGSSLWHRRHPPIARHGYSGQAYRTDLALAEWLCRTADWIDPTRVPGPFHRFGGGASTPHPASLCWLLQLIRTHRSLGKDAPVSRLVQRIGSINSHAIPAQRGACGISHVESTNIRSGADKSKTGPKSQQTSGLRNSRFKRLRKFGEFGNATLARDLRCPLPNLHCNFLWNDLGRMDVVLPGITKERL